jgi:hypothetical protein
MAGTAHTHVQMAARVMWKPNFAGEGAFRPFQSRPLLRSAACLTKAASGDLQLVKREGEAHIILSDAWRRLLPSCIALIARPGHRLDRKTGSRTASSQHDGPPCR